MSWRQLVSTLTGKRQQTSTDKASARFSESELQQAIERVVDEINPRIRALSGYRRKLRPCVAHALTHCAELVTRVPPGVDVSSKSWGRNPLVRAFFSGVGELRRIFSDSKELQDYFSQHTDAEYCYALLSLDYRERTVLGMELHGEMIKRDVKQTAVSFSVLRVVKPSPSEEELRKHLEQSAFENLISYVLERISDLLARRQLQEEQRQLQRIRAKVDRMKDKRLSALLCDECGENTDTASPCEPGVQNGNICEQTDARLETLEDYIDRIADVLDNPAAYFRVKRLTMHLSQMNIKLDKPLSSTDHTLELCEASLGEHLKRILMIARFPRSDLLPSRGFLE